jgi:hypothetical protein
MRFQKYALPLPNAKMLGKMSISQLDSFAASVVAAAEIFGIDCNIIEFNRITGNFDFSYKEHNSIWWNPSYNRMKDENKDRFNDIVLFLKYIYKVDTQNKFVKEFVGNGNSSKFDHLYCALTNEEFYYAFKKIKKTHELIYAFFKKIKLGNEYSHSVQYWEDKEAKLKNKGEVVWA